jgi:hypothetical protein
MDVKQVAMEPEYAHDFNDYLRNEDLQIESKFKAEPNHYLGEKANKERSLILTSVSWMKDHCKFLTQINQGLSLGHAYRRIYLFGGGMYC